jgi:tRNA modification GTPase
MPYASSHEDTIAAIATPLGQAGIGIVRISGSRSREIATKIFRPKRGSKDLKSHSLILGHLIDPVSGGLIDEVLLTFMKAPHSFTREDVVEINAHSGFLLLSSILHVVLKEGARLAKPGEFTFRAFMNGRIDLTQAEAIVDLINSRSERGIQLASQQIHGSFKDAIEALRKKTLEILAQVEVAIDFSEEESGTPPGEEMITRIEREVVEPIGEIIEAHAQRKIWMDGINTVIVGRVNGGKSSLLNRLLNEQRALVTPIPGTTRDIIESTLYIEGIPLRLMDTAGFRKGKGKIEKAGIRLTEKKLGEADLSLIVIDQSRPLTQMDRDVLSRSKGKKHLIIINKIDLPSRLDEIEAKKAFDGLPSVRISALTGEGIDDLRQAIRDLVLEGGPEIDAAHLAPNLRHKHTLQEAQRFFENAARGIREVLPLDVTALELQSGLEALGDIIGETTPEAVLDQIFSQFCIGK